MIVKEKHNGIRLDSYLAEVGAYNSRSIAAKFCDAGKVTVNGKAGSKKNKLQAGDTVEFEAAVENTKLAGEDIPLDIRYEDEEIIVLSKQPGLVCHPAQGHPNGTLVNALINHCGADHLCDIQTDHARLGIVHRLDADTSGLMICAKTNEAGLKLSQAMKDHTTLRCYQTLVFGNVKQDSGKIDVPLLRTLNKRPKMIGSNDANAKNATTTFKVINRIESSFGKFSLLSCKIITGRTHQIRAHMEYINHPVVGDPLYNSGAPKDFDAKEELNLNRQFLHSCKIGFNHPRTDEYIEFEDELPQDLKSSLEKLN